MLRDEEVRTDIGRCTGGTFVRVVNTPTGVERSQAPLGAEPVAMARSRLLREIENELAERGLSRFVISSPVGRSADEGA